MECDRRTPDPQRGGSGGTPDVRWSIHLGEVNARRESDVVTSTRTWVGRRCDAAQARRGVDRARRIRTPDAGTREGSKGRSVFVSDGTVRDDAVSRETAWPPWDRQGRPLGREHPTTDKGTTVETRSSRRDQVTTSGSGHHDGTISPTARGARGVLANEKRGVRPAVLGPERLPGRASARPARGGDSHFLGRRKEQPTSVTRRGGNRASPWDIGARWGVPNGPLQTSRWAERPYRPGAMPRGRAAMPRGGGRSETSRREQRAAPECRAARTPRPTRAVGGSDRRGGRRPPP